MLRRAQPGRADKERARTYYKSQSWAPWLYVQEGRAWYIYASDGAWVRTTRRPLPARTRSQLQEIGAAEGEALLSAGQATRVESERPQFRPHLVPPWKAPMLYLRWVGGTVFLVAVFVALAVVGPRLNFPFFNDKSRPAWQWAVEVSIEAAVWILVAIFAARERRNRRRHYKPWEQKDRGSQ
jgi:hypothetical protein